MPASKAPSLKGERVSVDLEAGSRSDANVDAVAARFHVHQLLGEGGMGSVFVAHDRGLGRVVALKRLRDELASDPGSLRRFILEAQIGAQLEHPNIVPLYSFERSEGGSPAIAMQLLEGTTMAEYIRAVAAAPAESRAMRGEYSLKERLARLLGACEAIHFAHERGVIHRDLKPDNVMLGRFREVYVMDWGLARVTGSPVDFTRTESRDNLVERSSLVPAPPGPPDNDELATSPTIVASGVASRENPATATRQGDVMGTPQYMPPEQALGLIDQVGAAADQYALAVMLQELATLRPARSHTNAVHAMSQAVMNQLAPPMDLDDHAMHPAIVAIVERATRKVPAERYPSVSAFADDIRRFTRDEPVSVYPEGLARRTVRAAARRPVLAMAILSLCGFTTSAAIVAAVVNDAYHAKRQARLLDGTRRVLVAVTDRAHVIDVALSDLAASVQAVAAATVEVLPRDPASLEQRSDPLPVFAPFGGSGGMAASFDAAALDWPGKQPGAPLPANARRLEHLEPWLRQTLVDALPPAERAASAELQTAGLRAGHSALLRAFVGLQDGTFAQFPAHDVTGDPDIRERPWYRMARADTTLHWTRPIADVAKKTIRITAVLGIQVQGVFVGAAGCDMRVSALAPKLALTMPGFRRAYLVTEDGKVAVSETLEQSMLSHATNADADLELPPADEPGLVARIAKRETGGYLVAGDRLLVFSRLVSPPWTYVAEFERAAYFDD